MNKPESLKKHLQSAIPELRHNPERLLVFIDEGRIRSTAAPGLSFEYSYTLNIIFTDYAGHPDAVAVPVLAWLMVNQRELIENLERSKDVIQFEVDILDGGKVDLSITLPLTERVIVTPQDGKLVVSHAPEPTLDEFLPAGTWELTADGLVLSEWESTELAGQDIAMPHPKRHG
jgi:hypothetical protein